MGGARKGVGNWQKTNFALRQQQVLSTITRGRGGAPNSRPLASPSEFSCFFCFFSSSLGACSGVRRLTWKSRTFFC